MRCRVRKPRLGAHDSKERYGENEKYEWNGFWIPDPSMVLKGMKYNL